MRGFRCAGLVPVRTHPKPQAPHPGTALRTSAALRLPPYGRGTRPRRLGNAGGNRAHRDSSIVGA
ncbi:hypothetical protein GCM10010381_36280 [Streptomyces xantholiticus]|nr:hypothetical protein GCM10010381_36280 [Streptomyces xantholiticus]